MQNTQEMSLLRVGDVKPTKVIKKKECYHTSVIGGHWRKYVVYYNSEGQLVSKVRFTKESILEVSTFVYGADGTVRAMVERSCGMDTINTSPISQKIVIYDEHHNLMSMIHGKRGVDLYCERTYDEDGKLLFTKENKYSTTYEYDEKGRLIRETFRGVWNDAAINVRERKYGEDGRLSHMTIRRYNINTIEHIQYKWDDNGRMMAEDLYDDGIDKPRRRTQYEYNTEGYLSKTTHIDGDGKIIDTLEYVYEYYDVDKIDV